MEAEKESKTEEAKAKINELQKIMEKDLKAKQKEQQLEDAAAQATLQAEEARLREVAADKEIVRLLEEKRKATIDRQAAIEAKQKSAESKLK